MLTHLLSQCSDFVDEITDLEHLCEDISTLHGINSLILFTPKFHCKLAGEGIEYSWGALKKIYRRIPLKQKRSASNFDACVRNCISRVTPLMANRFSAKVCSYMMGYKHRRMMINECQKTGKDMLMWSHDYNERIHKIHHGHYDANTIKGKYIDEVMKDCIQLKSCKKELDDN